MSSETGSTHTTGPNDDLALSKAVFPGLVYSQAGEAAPVVSIGGVAHYAIPEDGFMRHVEAFRIDNAVIAALQEQMLPVRDEIVQQVLEMMGTDDILAKAALEASLRNMGQSIRHSDPNQWAPLLRVYGFRIIVDVHGHVVEIIQPSLPSGTDEE